MIYPGNRTELITKTFHPPLFAFVGLPRVQSTSGVARSSVIQGSGSRELADKCSPPAAAADVLCDLNQLKGFFCPKYGGNDATS